MSTNPKASNKSSSMTVFLPSEILCGLWNEQVYVALITLSFIIRATTAILWMPLVSYHIFLLFKTNQLYSVLLKRLAPLSIVITSLSVFVDSFYHGRFVFVHWNFFQLNLVVDVSSQCGKQPMYGYVLIGMWTVNFVGIFLFSGIIKIWKEVPDFQVYIVAGFSTFFTLSSIGHKEVRFWLPCLPLCLCVSSYYMHICKAVARNKKIIYFLTIICNFTVLYYELFFIKFGPSNATNFLNNDIMQLRATKDFANLSILFMTNCYETPLYSHMHLDVEIDIAPCPLIIKEDWKAIIDNHRQNVWLNDDTNLLMEYPHLYLFKNFRHPMNKSEFIVDKFNQKYLSNHNNTWDTFYQPKFTRHTIKENLTEKMLETYKDFKVYGIDKPMPSHIVTLNSRGYEVYHQFLKKKEYEIIKSFLHSSKFFIDNFPEMHFNIGTFNINLEWK